MYISFGRENQAGNHWRESSDKSEESHCMIMHVIRTIFFWGGERRESSNI